MRGRCGGWCSGHCSVVCCVLCVCSILLDLLMLLVLFWRVCVCVLGVCVYSVCGVYSVCVNRVCFSSSVLCLCCVCMYLCVFVSQIEDTHSWGEYKGWVLRDLCTELLAQ
jgi:hypothetical protein